MTAGIRLMKSVLIPLAENVLLPFGLSAVVLATNAGIQKKIYGSGTETLLISKEEMEGLMKIVKPIGQSGLLIKGIGETIKSKTKEQKGRFLPKLLGTPAASLLGSALGRKGIIRAGEGVIRAGQNF